MNSDATPNAMLNKGGRPKPGQGDTMKTISLNSRSKETLIQATGCIINVQVGLHDSAGRPVTRVDIKCDQYAGEQRWYLPDYENAAGIGIRIVGEEAGQ